MTADLLLADDRSERADLALLVDAALAAGREAMTFFRNDVKIWWKNEGTSPVTAADHAANDILENQLAARGLIMAGYRKRVRTAMRGFRQTACSLSIRSTARAPS